MTAPLRSGILLIAIGLFCIACPKTPSNTGPVVDDAPPDNLREVLGTGDVFEVRVFDEETLSGTHRVEADGTVVYPLLGPIRAVGLTATELAMLIRDGLADGYLNSPQVSVFVTEYNSRKVSVLGQVNEPGRYAYRTGMTLIEAIAEAGGTTESAVLATMRVTRQRSGEELSFDVPFKEITQGRVTDFALHPGDIVFVAESAVK